MMEAIYKSAMEEDLGCGLEIKSQQELFNRQLSSRKRVIFYVTDQLEIELTLPPASSLVLLPGQIRSGLENISDSTRQK
ncbi:hypothetical protein RhiirC2_784626 [Rhizophagus irregularis]|uniref:Uncharacterized protein n=1 Tax=Rhizophagus irregularis TaxID=588596 RepID=A0A2N1MY29_9GLOM|nr:hypothetical protein RhiirC2_784626 [Rhizophagus irregularis]